MTALFANALNAQNPIFDSDSYKFSHAGQYPAGTEIVSSYIEPRRGWKGINEVLFFGLQIELAKMAAQPITQAMINEAAPVLQAHGLRAPLPPFPSRKCGAKYRPRLLVAPLLHGNPPAARRVVSLDRGPAFQSRDQRNLRADAADRWHG